VSAGSPAERPRVTAVVVNLNQRDLLRDCLASLDHALRAIHGASEVIVVDNASTDGSAEMVGVEFPRATLKVLDHNIGFAGGVNVGIRSSTGEWIFCVNNDATVAPDSVVELLRVAESDERIGSVAALMVFADRPDVINSAGIEIDRLGIATDRLLGEPVGASESEPIEVFGTSAGAALYRRAMLDEVPFDETFFAYYEDVDLAWRARMRDWRCMYAPRAVVHHHFSATARHGSPLKYYWSGRNRIRVLARNASGSQLRRYGLPMLLFDLGYVVVVLAIDRSTAPISGRVAGLRSWRADRRAAAPHRRPVKLAPFLGFLASYRRFRAGPRAGSVRVRDQLGP
jgi:GT2 family glycosyltransferase